MFAARGTALRPFPTAPSSGSKFAPGALVNQNRSIAAFPPEPSAGPLRLLPATPPSQSLLKQEWKSHETRPFPRRTLLRLRAIVGFRTAANCAAHERFSAGWQAGLRG